VLPPPVAVAPTVPKVSQAVPMKQEVWKPRKGHLLEVNVGDEDDDEEDGQQWLPGLAESNVLPDGTLQVVLVLVI
jgi:hypothetical protein